LKNADSLIDDWPGTLALIGENLGPGTKSLLELASPSRFENGVLTLEFPASEKMSKEMCESNGRVEQIQTMLSEQFSTPLKLNLELADAPTKTKAQTKQEKTHTQRDNELINDPAVKTVLLGLDAKVIGIDED
jgi:hypothetical protein